MRKHYKSFRVSSKNPSYLSDSLNAQIRLLEENGWTVEGIYPCANTSESLYKDIKYVNAYIIIAYNVEEIEE